MGQFSKAPAKRSQHVNATYRNIVERNMLRAFGHHVEMCCNMLDFVGSSLKLVKFEPTTPNMSQHIATRWPNARNMLHPTMLRYVVLACCDRLAGALENLRLHRQLEIFNELLQKVSFQPNEKTRCLFGIAKRF